MKNKGCDYYIEFYKELYHKLEFFVEHWNNTGPILLGKHTINIPLRTFLFYRLIMERDSYNFCRLNGMSVSNAMKRVDDFLNTFKREDAPITDKQLPISDIREHPWYEILNENQGVLIVYIFNARQLGYLTPLLQVMDIPVLLLSEYDIPEDTDLPETVMTVSMDFSMQRVFADKEFEYKFPLVFHYTNTLDILFRILRPCGVVCLEGAHFQEQLLASVAASYDVPSFVIQQGWPSMMHAGFRQWSFRYFLTWGEQFDKLWRAYHPHPCFISTGYMYEVPVAEPERKKCVTFFLQSTFYLSDRNYFNALLDLVSVSARSFPEVTFLVREHPDYKLDNMVFDRWKNLPNVKIVSDCTLQEVYARTRIVVSHFSSSLMEGVLYDAVPLVYDPTTESRYFPDVEKMGLGRITTSTDEFLVCLKNLLSVHWQAFPEETKRQWFTRTGKDTLDYIARFIHKNCLCYENESVDCIFLTV